MKTIKINIDTPEVIMTFEALSDSLGVSIKKLEDYSLKQEIIAKNGVFGKISKFFKNKKDQGKDNLIEHLN